MRIAKHFLLLLALTALFVSGCKKKHTPTPEDTIMGSGYSQRPDYIKMNEAYMATLKEEGLSLRENIVQVDFAAHSKEHAFLSVYFGFDNFSLDTVQRNKLVEINRKLNEDPQARFLIVGHCSYHGTAAYNMALGEKRAKSVEDYLIKTGAHPASLETVSRGDLDASARTGTKEETAQDRRADLVLIH